MGSRYDGVDEDAYYEELYIENIIEENREEIVSEFQDKRLSSYYLANKDIKEPAILFIKQTEEILDINHTAAFIFAFAASEYVIKAIILKPIVIGMVHDENVDELIAEITMKDKGFLKLLFSIVEKYDDKIQSFVPAGWNSNIKDMYRNLNKKRNGVVHRCEAVSKKEATIAIELANILLKDVFGKICTALGIRTV